jgi:[ribosomal protein S5]-alanine N-acetyltransferase
MTSKKPFLLSGKVSNLKTIQREDIQQINTFTGNIESIGEYFTTIVRHEHYWLQCFDKTGLWEEDKGTLIVTDTNGIPVGLLWFFKGLEYINGFEVGYNIFNPEFRNKGICTEALFLFSAYLFDVHLIARLQCNALEENKASRRVAEKCGYIYEGMMREAIFIRGSLHNLALFSLLRYEIPDLTTILQGFRKGETIDEIRAKNIKAKQ